MDVESLKDAAGSSYFLENGYEVVEVDGGIALRNNK